MCPAINDSFKGDSLQGCHWPFLKLLAKKKREPQTCGRFEEVVDVKRHFFAVNIESRTQKRWSLYAGGCYLEDYCSTESGCFKKMKANLVTYEKINEFSCHLFFLKLSSWQIWPSVFVLTWQPLLVAWQLLLYCWSIVGMVRRSVYDQFHVDEIK